MKLIDGLEVKYFAKGQAVIKEGEEGNYFYIIEDVSSVFDSIGQSRLLEIIGEWRKCFSEIFG